MKRNLRILIALALFYILVAVFAVILLGGKSSIFNRDRNSFGAKPAVMSQTVIGEEADNTQTDTAVEDAPVVTEPEPAPEPEPEPEEEEVAEPEPVVYEPRYFSFRTTNTQPDLRFRTAPSEDASIITKLFPGTGGYILEPGNKWCKVVSNSGREGYLATEFLALTEWTEETFPEKYVDMVAAPTEELTVPQFTTLLKDGSETESEEGTGTGEGTDTASGTETTDGAAPAEPAPAEAAPAATETATP